MLSSSMVPAISSEEAALIKSLGLKTLAFKLIIGKNIYPYIYPLPLGGILKDME